MDSTLSPSSNSTGGDGSRSLYDVPIPAIIVVVLCLVMIIVSVIVLVLLLKKTKRRVVLVKAPDVENPHYNHLTIRSENVLKRLSMRIINRLSVYSHQSDTLSRRGSTRNTATLTRQLPAPSPSPSAKVSSTMSPKLITNYFSFVDSPDCPESPSQHSYENTPMTSSSVAITSNSTTSSDSTTIPVITIVHHKRDDSEVYCVPETNDMDNRPYSQLHIPIYSDSLQDGTVVPTEDERSTSLCEHLVKSVNLYNKLQFFEQTDDFWLPASTASGLYTQLSIRKYREISKAQIKIHTNIGSGNFATVFQGEWLTFERTLNVAVKILQAGAKVIDRVKFLQEAAIMGQFCHPNIVRLHGVVTLGEPTMIVLELLSNGDLLTYLNKLNPSPDPREQDPLQRLFVKFSREISSGMEHLSKKRFIHRDLAARNILLTEDLTCKIGDFGMARNLLDEDYYNSRGGKIPVKWTAPEALLYKKYSTDSDVWSYGILLYEMWSLGKKPFPDLSTTEMISQAATGLCHAPPPGLPRAIYILMVDCWNPQHSKRPSFDKICTYLNQPETILLQWSDRDLSVSPLVHSLGANLSEAKGLYRDLRYIYQHNNETSFTRGASERHKKDHAIIIRNKLNRHSSVY